MTTPRLRYLVTGGAGFIGCHIVERLLRDGHEVRVLDNFSTGRRENLDGLRKRGVTAPFELLEGDIRSLDTCRAACRDRDYVLHQAAIPSVQRSIENPGATTEVNVGGTVNVLAAAKEREVRRVVIASSSSVYGDTPVLPKHERMTPTPQSPYAASKLADEQFATVFARTMGLETVSLRYFNVFGPRQDPRSDYAAVIPRFITALLTGKRPTIYGDGTQSRDFTFIDNVVEANLAASARGGGGGGAYNIASGEAMSLLQLLEALGAIIGVKSDPAFEPPRQGDVKHSLADVSAAGAEFAYRSRVSFHDGLQRTVEAYRSHS
jgi:UDP-glucose 4-epimerase